MQLEEVVPEPIAFDWNEANRAKNWRKHRVAMHEAQAIFLDTNKLVAADSKHSHTEPRYVVIGQTEHARCLFVVFTMRGSKVRIISARPASRKEVSLYETSTTKVQK